MKFKPKPTRKKAETTYKSLYIKCETVKRIEQIAEENDTSFNNVIISIVEKYL